MRLTRQSEYGLMALLYLYRSGMKEHVPLSRIARVQKLPLKYMEHLMHKLCREGYVVGSRGKKGGYCLGRPAEKISVAEIVRLFDGPLAPTKSVSKYFYKATPIKKEKKLMGLMRKIRNYISQTLEATSLADMA